MKTMMIILGLLVALSTSAQELTAADHLIAAKKAKNTALVITGAGIGVGGMAMAMNSDNAAVGAGLMGIGALVGIILNVKGNGHLGKAGEAMKESRIAFKPTRQGVGLTFAINK